MGVRILSGKDEGGTEQACLFSSTTAWAFGPVFDGVEAKEQAERFCKWFADGDAYRASVECNIKPGLLYADDPRGYSEVDLECLYNVWRVRYLDDDGYLLEVPNV